MRAFNRATLLKQLIAMRGQIDAAIYVLVDAEEEDVEQPKCQHPPDKRRNLTVMGGPERWVCNVCGYMHEGEGVN